MSKSAVVAPILLLLGVVVVILSSIAIVVVEGRVGNANIVSGPTCSGWSDNKRYNKNVHKLMDKLVDETNKIPRGPSEDYKYRRNYPATNQSGGAYGEATCNHQLGKTDCWACLALASGKFLHGCAHPVRGTLELKDCSMWFNQIL